MIDAAAFNFSRIQERAFDRFEAFKIERGVYSHNCSKLKKTNLLLEKISVQFINSKNSSPSIDTSRPSRDRHIALLNLNFDVKVLIQSHCALILSLSFLST